MQVIPFIILYHHKGAQRNSWHSNTAHSPPPEPPYASSILKLPISGLLGDLHGLMWVQDGSK